jgi:tripartite-type tricarboxylate transporter receptor subunit TctC
MNTPPTRRSLLQALALAPLLGCTVAQAQAWPTKPIRMVVPFPPGGGFDAVARPYAEKLAAVLKQTVIVDNKAGAGGNIGTAEVARAPADGYTILFANEILATNPNVYKSVPFDPIKDFEPISMVATTPLALAVYPGLPARNLAELVALSARQPLTFGTPGVGTSPHLFGELLNLKTPLKLRHIPYRGSGPAITDAMGGQTDAVLTSASSLAPHLNSGKLRGMALLSDKRSTLLPDLPTLAEGGIKGLTHNVWYALMAPAGTPAGVLQALREASGAVLRDAELAERLRKLGIDVSLGDDKAVTALIRSDMQRWAAVVADSAFPRE